MRSRVGRRVATLALCVASAAGAQETRCERGDVEVRALSFSGNAAFSDAELAAGIVTTPSSWARRTFRVVGLKHCLDADEFPLDLLRLTVWYRNHGFVDATVDTVVTHPEPGVVQVRFQIVEGEPVLVDTVQVDGLDGVPEAAQIREGLPARVGGRFDRYANRATRDSITRRLRNSGYPEAETFLGYDTRTLERRATVRFTVVPGPRRRIGALRIARTGSGGGAPEIPAAAVRRLSGLTTGDLYRERLLERAKRTLYQSEAFAQVEVQPGEAGADSLLPIDIALTEGVLRSARFGGGWGTLDCFRTTGELTDYNLFRSATRLELRGRVSKIGVGAPLDGAESLCSGIARCDQYSDVRNYYVSATVSQPSVLRTSFIPTLSLYSERRSEFQAFLRTAPIGASLALARALPRRTHSLGYSIELGRTEAQPALFCAVFNACVADDREALQRLQRLAVFSAATSYERTDDPADPTRGLVGRLEARHASKATGSDLALQFTRLSLDGSTYVRVAEEAVLALRVRLGGVLGPTLSFDETERFVPAQERLFAGGPTTVRGFRQNELGPAVYIPEAFDTLTTAGARTSTFAVGDTVFFQAADSTPRRAVPTGGNMMVVGNLELRLQSPFFPELLRWTLFADAGRVWNRGAGVERLRFSALRVTPGLGVRIRTPIGYLRADLAYNPYDPVEGAAYFDAPLTEGGALFCVSPGNTLAVTKRDVGGGRVVVEQATGVCPVSLRPPRAARILRRFTPTFAIGQAF
ncbi:MAG: outer membrane protein assembly factor [Gemmatimonadota bacterium]